MELIVALIVFGVVLVTAIIAGAVVAIKMHGRATTEWAKATTYPHDEDDGDDGEYVFAPAPQASPPSHVQN